MKMFLALMIALLPCLSEGAELMNNSSSLGKVQESLGIEGEFNPESYCKDTYLWFDRWGHQKAERCQLGVDLLTGNEIPTVRANTLAKNCEAHLNSMERFELSKTHRTRLCQRLAENRDISEISLHEMLEVCELSYDSTREAEPCRVAVAVGSPFLRRWSSFNTESELTIVKNMHNPELRNRDTRFADRNF